MRNVNGWRGCGIFVLQIALCMCVCSLRMRAESKSWTIKPYYETPARSSVPTSLVLVDDNGLQHAFYNESYAVLIMEGEYSTGGWQSVSKSAHKNEESLRKSLEGRGFRVIIWRDLNGDQIQPTLNEIFRSLGVHPMSRLFFYYYGHGYSMRTDSEPSGTKSYLVPVGAPNPVADEEGFRQVALSVSQIVEYARQITVKHAFFALEACDAGAYAEYLGGIPVSNPKGYLLTPQSQLPVRQILSAGTANQDVLADSHFTPLLVEALEKGDLNGDGYVTGAEVMAYVAQKLPQLEQNQNPVLGTMPRTGGGDFVFGPASPGSNTPQTAAKRETVFREWRSPELQVDCNRANSGRIQASILLDSRSDEKVVNVAAHYEGANIKDLNWSKHSRTNAQM